MSRLTDLLARLKSKDAQLGLDLEREVRALSSRLPFGLNFERHSPEAVELPLRPIRKGDKVRVLAPRGSLEKGDQRLWLVKNLQKKKKLADLELIGSDPVECQTVSSEDLVVIAEFRDTIYPGLISTGKVVRGGNSPFHIVINGENYHVLKALTYTHRGKIDAIYIDPPYNTGAKDWKYNNDYVEADDQYRHSKWLAMMERRLLVAKELLNPEDSVLIVTIDEKEYLRLGMLLEQTFSEARIQMISSVINPKGAVRASSFGRTDEYIFFVMFGLAAPSPSRLSQEWKIVEDKRASTLRWAELLRSGSNTARSDSQNQFYPVFIKITEDGPIFHSVGEAYFGTNLREIEAPDDCSIIWPIRSDGTEGNWQISPGNLRILISKGYAKLGRWRRDQTAITYLKRGEQKKIQSGIFPVLGRRADNSIIVDSSDYEPVFIPGTQWRIGSHNAEQGGTNLLKLLIPGRKFPFPKSLYAVEDTLRFFVANKPSALVLDFFAGSGTTSHAIMRLNRQDNGRRQCISVTNNEVAADEQKVLSQSHLRPGDKEWESLGICEQITKPRVAAAISGVTVDNQPIEGCYKFTDEFSISEGFEANAEFFTLTYEARDAVNFNLAFKRISPLLWLRAGAQGNRIDELPASGWAIADTYAILANLDQAAMFVREVSKHESVILAYIVSDDDRRFQSISKRLPKSVEPVRLYESYLTNFSFANGE